MMSAKVSLIILNWNGRPYLEGCLSSVMAQTYPDFEAVLVDNGSTDGSAEFVAQRFPQVHIIRHDENLGFAAGNNTAIRATQSPYVATLNNNAQVESTWLAKLGKAMEADDQVGMCASKMLYAHQPHVIDSAGLSPDVAGIAWNRRRGERDRGDDAGPREVFGACAGAALYRRATLNQIGLFDEDFFAYLEDADLAWRARPITSTLPRVGWGRPSKTTCWGATRSGPSSRTIPAPSSLPTCPSSSPTTWRR
jgi:GT2 family glycosyltransferase